MEAPLFISATGPDGAGKDTAWRHAKPHLPEDITIVKIGKPSSIIRGGNEEYVHQPVSKVLDQFHSWADAKRSRHLTLISNFLYVMFQWRVQEPLLIHQINPDLVFSLRDGYVDPAAYAPFYSGSSLGRLAIPDRISALRAMHGSPFRDLTIYMDVDPQTAVARIEERMRREAVDSNGVIRPKWVHQHENERDLAAIRTEYFAVLDHVKGKRGTDVIQLSTTEATKSEIGAQLAKGIIDRVKNR